MEQSILSSQNQLTYETQRIRLEELEPTALQVRKRAIEARSVGEMFKSLQVSCYNVGGWRSMFEEYVPQPLSSNGNSENSKSSNSHLAPIKFDGYWLLSIKP